MTSMTESLAGIVGDSTTGNVTLPELVRCECNCAGASIFRRCRMSRISEAAKSGVGRLFGLLGAIMLINRENSVAEVLECGCWECSVCDGTGFKQGERPLQALPCDCCWGPGRMKKCQDCARAAKWISDQK